MEGSNEVELKMNTVLGLPMIGKYTLVRCRSLRIGSYNFTPKEDIMISWICVRMRVPSIKNSSHTVTLSIGTHNIVHIIANFGRRMPVILLYIKPEATMRIRTVLNMKETEGPYYNPTSQDDAHNRMIIFPEYIDDNNKLILRSLFRPNDLLREVDFADANNILLAAAKIKRKRKQNKDNKKSMYFEEPIDKIILMNLAQNKTNKIAAKANNSPQKNEDNKKTVEASEDEKCEREEVMATESPGSEGHTIFLYPPTGTDSIPISRDDYLCLGNGRYINDIIIDFYIKYLTSSVISEADRERTFVFNTYFYQTLTNRLTTSSWTDPRVLPAEKRHSFVKRWTRQVNIFEKDFIVVPINEHYHWYLAIICFPGLETPVRMSDNMPADDLRSTNLSNTIEKQSSELETTTEFRVEYSAKTSFADTKSIVTRHESCYRDEEDEMDAELLEMFSDEGMQCYEIIPNDEPTNEPEWDSNERIIDEPTFGPIKQSCILIFDSMVGTNNDHIIEVLRDYLRIEWEHKYGTPRDFSEQGIRGERIQVPQQQNLIDCGIYLLQFVESFFENPIVDYRFPIKKLDDWFSIEIITRKRKYIRDLLLTLMKNNGVNIESLNLPNLVFSEQLDNEDLKRKTIKFCSEEIRSQKGDSVTGTKEDKSELINITIYQVLDEQLNYCSTNDRPTNIMIGVPDDLNIIESNEVNSYNMENSSNIRDGNNALSENIDTHINVQTNDPDNLTETILSALEDI